MPQCISPSTIIKRTALLTSEENDEIWGNLKSHSRDFMKFNSLQYQEIG
jgi:hypothetical protein